MKVNIKMPEIDKEKIISKIKSAMDEIHGSGFNYEYEWLVKGSNLILKTYYRVMNDYGHIVSVIPVTVWFPSGNPENFRIRCKNTGYCLGIRDMLTYTIYHALQGN